MVSKALDRLCEEPQHSFNKFFRRGWPALANFFILPKQFEPGRAAGACADYTRLPRAGKRNCRNGPTRWDHAASLCSAPSTHRLRKKREANCSCLISVSALTE